MIESQDDLIIGVMHTDHEQGIVMMKDALLVSRQNTSPVHLKGIRNSLEQE